MEVNKRFYSLDIFKIIATIFIVFHHYQQISRVYFQNQVNFFGGKFNFGYMVELFFILSGFFMFSYIKKIKDGLSFKEFYFRRAKRLLPPVVVSAITYVILLFIYEKIYLQAWSFGRQPSLWGIVITSLGIQDGWVFDNPYINNPTWYISVLFLCYAIFYITTILSQKTTISNKYFYLGMIFIGCGVQTYNINLPLFNTSSCRGFYAFFTGVLLSIYMNGRKITRKEVMIIIASSIIIIWNIIFNFDFISNGLVYLLTFILYPSLIILMCTPIMKQIFASSFWGGLAEISFGAYIWHLPIYIALCIFVKMYSINFDFSNIINMYFYCAIVEVVAILSFVLIERPLQKSFKRKKNFRI